MPRNPLLHATLRGYARGCRCEPCVDAAREHWQRPEYRERARRWRSENRDHLNAYIKGWRERNPGKHKAIEARRRSRMESFPVEHVSPAYIAERDGHRCHICGKHVIKRDASLDHLIPIAKGGGHTADNLALAHRRCNSRRGAGRLPAQLRLIG